MSIFSRSALLASALLASSASLAACASGEILYDSDLFGANGGRGVGGFSGRDGGGRAGASGFGDEPGGRGGFSGADAGRGGFSGFAAKGGAGQGGAGQGGAGQGGAGTGGAGTGGAGTGGAGQGGAGTGGAGEGGAGTGGAGIGGTPAGAGGIGGEAGTGGIVNIGGMAGTVSDGGTGGSAGGGFAGEGGAGEGGAGEGGAGEGGAGEGGAGPGGAGQGGAGTGGGGQGGAGTGGAGGSSGSAGAGGFPPGTPGICAPLTAAVVVEPGVGGIDPGPTNKTENVTSGSCVGKSTIEQLLKITPTESGTLIIDTRADSTNTNINLYVRDNACDGKERICTAAGNLKVLVTKDEPVFLYIEQENPSVYSVLTNLTVPGSSVDTCPEAGDLRKLAADNIRAFYSNTALGSAFVDPPASCTTAKTGKEIVFQLQAEANGTLDITLTPKTGPQPGGVTGGTFDGVLSIIADCKKADVATACTNLTAAGGSERLTVPAVAGTIYYVVVDSIGGNGDFELSVVVDTTP